ncbi:MAG TPA: protein kinase [Steroidobacteraceae bacterium]|jgi:DNA-binding response OmpR family regulator
MKPRLLIIDTERELRTWLRHHIEVLWPGSSVEELEPTELEAQAVDLTSEHLDLIVLGAQCGESLEDSMAGLDPLRLLQRRDDVPPIVVIASGGSELNAVRAMRLGAADYLPRRLLDAQRLATALRLALRKRRRGAARSRPSIALPRRIDPPHLDLPQYAILHKLGESSRAVVYFAHSVTLGRNVALKISKPTIEDAEESREFAREYAAICAVRHRSVVEIYDYGFHAGREFIAMEYFPCGDLKTRLQQPMSVPEALGYALRICGALRVIHAAGLIHRDLKPPNVMLREDSSVVLIDFGLAKGLDSTGHSTAYGVLRGSPYYMSPEQAQGIPLDARSDLYSVGVMLHEMLTGVKPYIGNSAVEVMQQHVHGPRPALPAALSQLEPLLEQMMARDRAKRFVDAVTAYAAIMAAIDRLAADSPPLAAEASGS